MPPLCHKNEPTNITDSPSTAVPEGGEGEMSARTELSPFANTSVDTDDAAASASDGAPPPLATFAAAGVVHWKQR